MEDEFYHEDSDEFMENEESSLEDQWFYEECLELKMKFKDWAERNGLFLFEKLTTDDIEEFICCKFNFHNKTMELDDTCFQYWKTQYEKWLLDFKTYETAWTYFADCPFDNLCWFIYKTSSRKISHFL